MLVFCKKRLINGNPNFFGLLNLVLFHVFACPKCSCNSERRKFELKYFFVIEHFVGNEIDDTYVSNTTKDVKMFFISIKKDTCNDSVFVFAALTGSVVDEL